MLARLRFFSPMLVRAREVNRCWNARPGAVVITDLCACPLVTPGLICSPGCGCYHRLLCVPTGDTGIEMLARVRALSPTSVRANWWHRDWYARPCASLLVASLSSLSSRCYRRCRRVVIVVVVVALLSSLSSSRCCRRDVVVAILSSRCCRRDIVVALLSLSCCRPRRRQVVVVIVIVKLLSSSRCWKVLQQSFFLLYVKRCCSIFVFFWVVQYVFPTFIFPTYVCTFFVIVH